MNDQLEYMDYLRSQGATDDEAREYMKDQGIDLESAFAKAGGPVGTAYLAIKHGILPALDYTSSLGRGAIAGGVQAATGKNLGINLHDVVRGKTPQSEELLRRGGVPKMDYFPDQRFVPSGRTLLGFAGDVAADPINLIPAAGLYEGAKAGVNGAKSINAAGKGSGLLDTLLRPVSKTAEQAGSASWRSGMKRIDEQVARYGKKPVSDILMREGVSGNERQIYNQMNAIGERKLAEKNALLGAADQTGFLANTDASLEPAENFVKGVEMQGDPRNADAIEKMRSEIDLLRTVKASPSQMSALKTNSQQAAGEAAYRQSSNPGLYRDFQKALAAGQRTAAEAGVAGGLGEEAGQKLSQTNDELGRILTSKQRAERDAEMAANKNMFTSVDGMLVGNALGGGTAGGAGAALLKKIADVARTSRARTSGGKALVEASQNVPEAAWKQLLLLPTDRDGRN